MLCCLDRGQISPISVHETKDSDNFKGVCLIYMSFSHFRTDQEHSNLTISNFLRGFPRTQDVRRKTQDTYSYTYAADRLRSSYIIWNHTLVPHGIQHTTYSTLCWSWRNYVEESESEKKNWNQHAETCCFLFSTLEQGGILTSTSSQHCKLPVDNTFENSGTSMLRGALHKPGLTVINCQGNKCILTKSIR